MRVGAVFPQAEFGRGDPEQVLEFVRGIEDAGYDHLLLFDHVLGADSEVRSSWDGAYDHRDPFLEPLMLFAWLARECNLEFVTDVLVLPQRQTALVAKQLATLDVLAPGRVRLGVGIGWNEVEYDALGVDFKSRAARLEEQIPLLRRLWSEPSVDVVGATERVEAAGIAPLPSVPPPIWIGCGTATSAIDRVGRLADGWLPMPDVQPGRGFEAAWRQVQEVARDAGRNPSSIGLEGHVRVRGDDIERVQERVSRWRDVGAEAIAVNPLRAGLTWPHEHLDALRACAAVTVT